VSQTETALLDPRCFATVNFPGAVLFRKLERNDGVPERIPAGHSFVPDLEYKASSQGEPSEPYWEVDAELELGWIIAPCPRESISSRLFIRRS